MLRERQAVGLSWIILLGRYICIYVPLGVKDCFNQREIVKLDIARLNPPVGTLHRRKLHFMFVISCCAYLQRSRYHIVLCRSHFEDCGTERLMASISVFRYRRLNLMLVHKGQLKPSPYSITFLKRYTASLGRSSIDFCTYQTIPLYSRYKIK